MSLETRIAKLEASSAQRSPAMQRRFDSGVVTEARTQRIRDELARRGLSYDAELLRIKTLVEGDDVLSNPHFEAVRLEWKARRLDKTK